eukprot:3755283-Pleurochrysis_carterae.AAC.1
MATSSGCTCGSPPATDSSTAARSPFPRLGESRACSCCTRNAGAASPRRRSYLRTPCSTPSLSASNCATDN